MPGGAPLRAQHNEPAYPRTPKSCERDSCTEAAILHVTMLLFGKSQTRSTYAAIFEIGSGSVLAAIVASDPHQATPRIIWSQRELAPLRDISALEETMRSILTALTTSAMNLEQTGRATLQEKLPGARINEVFYSLAAPWAYTISKHVNYSQDKPFTITSGLIDELTQKAKEQITTELSKNERVADFDLQLISESTIAQYANGYRIEDPTGEQAADIRLALAHVVTPKRILDAVAQVQDSIAPHTTARHSSFMLTLYTAVRALLPQQQEVCLVDITYEATEIGIMRGGVLRYCTHTPFGSYSLARELAAILNVPLHEAFGYLHADRPFGFMDDLSADQAKEVEAMFDAYVARLHELFQATGDELSIPRRLIIHADLRSEAFFTTLIEQAVKRTIRSSAHITPITKTIRQRFKAATDTSPEAQHDSALLLAAYVFHIQHATQAPR